MNGAHPSLTRQLGTGSAILLGLGSIFGTGVFVSIGIATGVTGVSVIGAIIIAAGLASCNALSSAQLAAAHPISGGTYEYGYRWLGPRLGFAAGWMFLLAKSASAASAAIGVVIYAAYLFGVGVYIPLAAAGVTLLMTALVASGLRRSNIANVFIVSLTVLALTAFVIFGLPHIETVNFTPVFAKGKTAPLGLFHASALMFVAFTGYGRIATLGEEVREPRRVIPKAIIATLFISTAVYLLVTVVFIGVIGAENFSEASLPSLQEAARSTGYKWLSWIVSIGALTAMLGVLLNLLLGLSRVMLAMARRGDMPRSLAAISPSGSPVFAVLVMGCAVTGIALIGDIKAAWSFSAVTVLIYYAITNLAALQLEGPDRLYPRWISLLGLIGCLGLAVFIPPGFWGIAFGLLAIGLAWQWARAVYFKA